MAFTPVTLWANKTHRCILQQTDGRLEVLLYHDNHVTRLHTCDSESSARRLAYDWKMAVDHRDH
jgi:hypothetical protein